MNLDDDQEFIGRDESGDRAEATVWLAVKILMCIAVLDVIAEVIRDGL